MDVKGADDRAGHMERETAVGGEKQGQIKRERGRCRKRMRESEGGRERQRQRTVVTPSPLLLIRY